MLLQPKHETWPLGYWLLQGERQGLCLSRCFITTLLSHHKIGSGASSLPYTGHCKIPTAKHRGRYLPPLCTSIMTPTAASPKPSRNAAGECSV